MPRSQSVMTTRLGEFRRVYRLIQRRPEWRKSTPIVFCEGDSWFSTPLAMNMLDWLVYAPPEIEELGVPVFGAGGLFFRAEESGHHAAQDRARPGKAMFVPDNIGRLGRWHKRHAFDIVILSAGGNDFTGPYLESVFSGVGSLLTPEEAYGRVSASGQFEVVRDAYHLFVEAMFAQKPDVPILSHTYDYPRLLGTKADLTLANIGAVALFAKGPGPWIGNHLRHVLPDREDQRRFTRLLIDGFVDNVLEPVKGRFGASGMFDYVDLRGTLPADADWFDEMHPTGNGFRKLAAKYRNAILQRLPAGKRMGP